MKLIYKLIILLLLTINLNAGGIYVTKFPNTADVKVYISSHPFNADLWVYIEDTKYYADGHDQYWYFVRYANRSSIKVYFVNSEYNADVVVYFVKYKNRAHWRTTDNKFLTKFR